MRKIDPLLISELLAAWREGWTRPVPGDGAPEDEIERDLREAEALLLGLERNLERLRPRLADADLERVRELNVWLHSEHMDLDAAVIDLMRRR